EEIQYIEAHGTATKLGDPIEIHALSDAFAQFTSKKRFCGIGSLKANIGHTTAASGVLSLIKVCLSMSHGQMPPSINFARANQHIDFVDSPVYVNEQLKPWPVNAARSRLAAISSFGFSGTNAHLVLEQRALHAKSRAEVGVGLERPALVVLSAKNEDRVLARTSQLLERIREAKDGRGLAGELDLRDLAYTLQVGRDAMECRVAFLVDSVEALRCALEAFRVGDESQAIRARRQGEIGLTQDEQTLIVDECIASGRWRRLLNLWVRGFDLDWRRLYAGPLPRRIALPTYPFARERFRVEIPQQRSAEGAGLRTDLLPRAATLHPLLQQNTSNMAELRFSSTLNGTEFFLRDHVINGRRILPAVCYLEMARAAIVASGSEAGSADEPSSPRARIRLRNVIWLRPLVVDDTLVVSIRLALHDERAIEFEVYTGCAEAADGEVVHARGVAMVDAEGHGGSIEAMDLTSLRAGCEWRIAADDCYEVFGAIGLSYGPAHRGVRS
ncbi:MAG: ketoacyl-synthetase C-terminal extension domain-containing protein, partial [Steroidobacteraceae bacterium]